MHPLYSLYKKSAEKSWCMNISNQQSTLKVHVELLCSPYLRRSKSRASPSCATPWDDSWLLQVASVIDSAGGKRETYPSPKA